MDVLQARVESVRNVFRKRRVVDMEVLCITLETKSRMTVFRNLRKLGYLSSYSHAGRYYTLLDIPKFDRRGLWQFRDACFSRYGTLKATIRHLVENGEAGYTHRELKSLLNIRVQNTINDLLKAGEIGREMIDGVSLYYNSHPEIAQKQLAQRQIGSDVKLDPYLIIRVLLRVIHEAERDPMDIFRALQADGISITIEETEEIFKRFDLKKKA